MKNNDYYDYEEDTFFIEPPYYRVLYIDDQGKRHLATIAEKNRIYLEFLKDRFYVVEIKVVNY